MSVLIYPTDTVWGIGAYIDDEISHRQIEIIKQSADKKPLSIMFDSLSSLNEYFSLNNFSNIAGSIDYNKIFSMEVTLLIPRNLFQKEIPYWIHYDSPYIGVRVLHLKNIIDIFKQRNMPFTTTSLNITGMSPIVLDADAFSFYNQYARDAIFYKRQGEALSGESSTILKFDNNQILIVRSGRYVNELKKFCNIL